MMHVSKDQNMPLCVYDKKTREVMHSEGQAHYRGSQICSNRMWPPQKRLQACQGRKLLTPSRRNNDAQAEQYQ
eukprot:6534978-Ditylum_brightwellii.AAC.1